jgi:hypothetical protein
VGQILQELILKRQVFPAFLGIGNFKNIFPAVSGLQIKILVSFAGQAADGCSGDAKLFGRDLAGQFRR